MPKTKFQRIIFGLIMSYAMAWVYNVAVKSGFNIYLGSFSSMMNYVFIDALKEASYMWLLVFLFSNLWGNRIGVAFSTRYGNIERDNPFFAGYSVRLVRLGSCVRQ